MADAKSRLNIEQRRPSSVTKDAVGDDDNEKSGIFLYCFPIHSVIYDVVWRRPLCMGMRTRHSIDT